MTVHDFGGSDANADRPLLVIAHATGFHGLMYRPLAERLSDSFHCVSFDFRAHGKSTLPDTASLDWHRITDDLFAVMDHFSPDEPVRVLGHSLGGACIALGTVRHPERFERVWAFEPILLPYQDVSEPSPLAEGARRRRPVFRSRGEARANYASKPPLSILSPEVMDLYVEHGFDDLEDGSVRLACLPEHEAAVFENAFSGSLDAAVNTAVAYGVGVGNDGGMPGQAARAAAAQGDHLTAIEMDLTHFGPLQDPDAVATEIRSWFL